VLEVGEDGVDDGGVGDVRDHPQGTGAERTDSDVELEGAFEALGPGQAVRGMLFGRARKTLGS
jgi:hypothetical protein